MRRLRSRRVGCGAPKKLLTRGHLIRVKRRRTTRVLICLTRRIFAAYRIQEDGYRCKYHAYLQIICNNLTSVRPLRGPERGSASPRSPSEGAKVVPCARSFCLASRPASRIQLGLPSGSPSMSRGFCVSGGFPGPAAGQPRRISCRGRATAPAGRKLDETRAWQTPARQDRRGQQ